MTPLAASLLFIVVSIVISTIKHFIFPSNSPSTSEQSSIELTKLYTITDKQPEKQNKSYASFYEAYHQFHISQAEEQKHRIEEKFMLQYNSLVMKKSIINDEFVIICEENYLVTVQQGVSCEGENVNNAQSTTKDNDCDWQTSFNVYELPLLKEQTKQTINVNGRIGIANHDQKSKTTMRSIQCKKIHTNKKYIISFPLLSHNSTDNDERWSLNKLFILKNDQLQQSEVQFKNQTENGDNSEKLQQVKNKKLQAMSYDIPKTNTNNKKSTNTSFQLQLTSSNLHHPSHHPKIFYSTQDSLCYTTEDEPWLIRCNTNQQWHQINILQKSIQDLIYENLSYSSRVPPFGRSEKIEVKFLFLFENRQNVYQSRCTINGCEEEMVQRKRNYVSVVYMHVNSPYRVEKFYVQLTFQILNQSSGEMPWRNSVRLVSHSLLISEMNPNRNIHSDCSIHSKTKNIIQRHYDKYHWLYQNKVIASIHTSSLLCVFRSDVDESLRVVEIPDLIYSRETNRYNELAFMDWKSLNKIINYKEDFEMYIKQKRPYNNTINKTQLQKGSKISSNQNHQSDSQKQQSQKHIGDYLQIIKQQYQFAPSQAKQSRTSKNTEKSQKNKKSQKKSSRGQKKQKSIKKKSRGQKKVKSTPKRLNKAMFSLLQGPQKPTIKNSYNYSLYRQTQFPQRSLTRKYKFPLPFLFSFTQNMQIINSQPSNPLVLFSGVKQYIFTYKHKVSQENSTMPTRVVDYRYLTLGPKYHFTSYFFTQSEGTPQHSIQTSKSVVDVIEEKTNRNINQKITIQIKDETHPEVQNVIKTMLEADEKILNQIKSIKSIPIVYKSRKDIENPSQNDDYAQTNSVAQTYQEYLIVVWGWGIQVYLVDWDKNGFFRKNITQEEIQLQLSQKNYSLIEYFLPFIELFATFYCMFQALISSR